MPRPEDRTQWMIRKLLPKRARRRVMEAWKLATASYVVVSYPKSGRTWLRAALTFYFAERYGLENPPLLEFANLHYLDRRIPKVYFTHDDNPNGRPEALRRDKSRYRRKRVLFLARDPRDVTVSMYFHRKNRDLDLDVPIFDFANGADGGLRTTIEFMNIWADALREIPQSHCLSYEAMHARPRETMADVLRFLGEEPDPHAVEVAIERARFDGLRAMERSGAFESSRLKPADTVDEDSFKVRRGKVGGFVDYFEPEQQRTLSRLVEERLSPFYHSCFSRN